MSLTDKEKNDRRQARLKSSGLVKLQIPITPELRDKFKLVIYGKAKIIMIKGK